MVCVFTSCTYDFSTFHRRFRAYFDNLRKRKRMHVSLLLLLFRVFSHFFVLLFNGCVASFLLLNFIFGSFCVFWGFDFQTIVPIKECDRENDRLNWTLHTYTPNVCIQMIWTSTHVQCNGTSVRVWITRTLCVCVCFYCIIRNAH